MKKRTKGAIIAGVIVAVVGVVVLLASLAMSEWNFNFGNNWEQEKHLSFTHFSKIIIKASAGKVVLKSESRDSVEINYDYNDRFQPSFEEKSDTLLIESGERKWYDINYWFNDAPTMEIIIPMQLKAEVYVEINAGSMEICGGKWGPLLDIELNAGAVTLGDVVVDELNIEVNAGAMQAAKLQCNTFNSEINAGALEVEQVTCDYFKGKVSAGGLNVKKIDGERISISVYAGAANLGLVGAEKEYSVSVMKNGGSCNVSSTGGGADFTHYIFIYISAGSVDVTFGK